MQEDVCYFSYSLVMGIRIMQNQAPRVMFP